ncbi:MAG: phage tail terminator-like protein [Alphaproteobacteria bacterium]
MSLLVIRQQLETVLDAVSTGQIETNYENVFYKPTKDVAFQRVQVVFATPENPTIGDNFYRDLGFMQVTLYFPLQSGAKDSSTWAQTLRTNFYRGRSFVTGKVTTTISQTMSRLPSIVEDDRFVVPCRIPFFVNVLP